MKLSAIASALDVRLENGSPDTEITGLNGIEQAGPGELTFVSNPKYSAAARTTEASAVIVGENFPAIPAAMLRAKDPYLTFARALELFHQPARYAPGVHPTAVVHASARIGANAHVGPYVVIGEDVEIGANAVLLAHVVIYRGVKIGDNFFAHAHSVVRENCRIGNNVLLQNGVVIGADGFGFAKTAEGRWHKIPQPAPVVIEDDVEVQANSCIDRASVGETHIGRGVKVDNLVQVGHGSQVGEDALLCAQVGLAGSSEIGNRVDSYGTGRRGGSLQGWGRRDCHAAERGGRRYCCRRAGQRSACCRSQAVAEIFGDPCRGCRRWRGPCGLRKSQSNHRGHGGHRGTTTRTLDRLAALGPPKAQTRAGEALLADRCRWRRGLFPSGTRGCRNPSAQSVHERSLSQVPA